MNGITSLTRVSDISSHALLLCNLFDHSSLLLLFIPLSSSLHVSPSLWILFSIHPFVPSLRYQYQCFCSFIYPHRFWSVVISCSFLLYLGILLCVCTVSTTQGPQLSFGLCWLASLCLIYFVSWPLLASLSVSLCVSYPLCQSLGWLDSVYVSFCPLALRASYSVSVSLCASGTSLYVGLYVSYLLCQLSVS